MISKMSISLNAQWLLVMLTLQSFVNKQQDGYPFHLHGFFLSWYLHSMHCPSHTGISDYHLSVMALVGMYPIPDCANNQTSLTRAALILILQVPSTAVKCIHKYNYGY